MNAEPVSSRSLVTRARRNPLRLVPHLAGLALAVATLWGGAATLERSVAADEPFSITPAAPAGVWSLADGPPRWTGEVRPADELARVRVAVHGADGGLRVPSGQRRGDDGQLTVELDDLADAPGWHFLELGFDRRGGRREGVVDALLVGNFATTTGGAQGPRDPADSDDGRCDLALRASQRLVERLARAQLERELLPVLRDVEQLGPDTTLHALSLELGEDRLDFRLELRGVNTLAVSGALALRIAADGRLDAELITLDEVDFRGRLRRRARALGAGGGAVAGALLAGPLAPVGALAGLWLADTLVTRGARKLVRAQLESGLATIAGVELIPAGVELVPGDPRSRVALSRCADTGVEPGGVALGLRMLPKAGELAGPVLGVPGPLVTGVSPRAALLNSDDEDADLHLELGVDLLNALLLRWSASGLLFDLAAQGAALERANDELAAWTPLRLAGLRPTRPPVLSPAGGPEAGWRFGLAGLVLELEGVDDQPWGEIQLAAAGELGLD